MYRCVACDAPSSERCKCAEEVVAEAVNDRANDDGWWAYEDTNRINVASNEAVELQVA